MRNARDLAMKLKALKRYRKRSEKQKETLWGHKDRKGKTVRDSFTLCVVEKHERLEHILGEMGTHKPRSLRRACGSLV